MVLMHFTALLVMRMPMLSASYPGNLMTSYSSMHWSGTQQLTGQGHQTEGAELYCLLLDDIYRQAAQHGVQRSPFLFLLCC